MVWKITRHLYMYENKALDDVHVDPHNTPKMFLVIKVGTITSAVVFTLEVFIRWIGLGIRNYFTDPWCIMEFIIVIVLIMEAILVYGYNYGHSLEFLRALRALRPLRFVNRVRGMQTIVDAIVLSIPAVLRVAVIILFFWLPFAILGVHLFAGTFSRCEDSFDNIINLTEVTNKTTCLEKNYTWDNNFSNFDNIGNSYMALLQLSTFGNLLELAELVADYKGTDEAPRRNYHAHQLVFIITFLLVGGYFSVDLCIVTVVKTFQSMLKHVKGGPIEFALTPSQKKYYVAMKQISRRKFSVSFEPPHNSFLNLCYRISESFWFRILTSFVICAYTITVAFSSYYDSYSKRMLILDFQWYFVLLYIIEFIIKILGLGRYYFKDISNIQDICILVAFFIGAGIRILLKAKTNPLSFLLAFRITRLILLLHLDKVFVSLRRLWRATIASIPSLLNLSLLLFIFHFIYAIIGISLFGNVKHGKFIDSQTNFETVIRSLLALFEILTTQYWEEVLEGLSIQPPNCELNHTIDENDMHMSTCGNKTAAIIYIVSFFFLTHLALVNIYIAVMLENYELAVSEDSDLFTDEIMATFNEVWKIYDPQDTQFIKIKDLSNLLNELDRDLRILKPNEVAISYMKIPVALGDKVHIVHVLQGILKIKAGHVEETEVFQSLKNQMKLTYEYMFPELRSTTFIGTTRDMKRKKFLMRKVFQHWKNKTHDKLSITGKERWKMLQKLKKSYIISKNL